MMCITACLLNLQAEHHDTDPYAMDIDSQVAHDAPMPILGRMMQPCLLGYLQRMPPLP